MDMFVHEQFYSHHLYICLEGSGVCENCRTVCCELGELIHEGVLVSSPVVWCLCLLPRACIDAALGLEQRWGALGETECSLFVGALKPVTVPAPNLPLLLLVPSTVP